MGKAASTLVLIVLSLCLLTLTCNSNALEIRAQYERREGDDTKEDELVNKVVSVLKSKGLVGGGAKSSASAKASASANAESGGKGGSGGGGKKPDGADFLGRDSATSGNWPNYYGEFGGTLFGYSHTQGKSTDLHIHDNGFTLAGGSQVNRHVFLESTALNMALMPENRDGNGRTLSCIFGNGEATLKFVFDSLDLKSRARISFYFVDYNADKTMPSKTADVYGYVDNIKDTPDTKIEEYEKGVYISYNIPVRGAKSHFFLRIVPRQDGSPKYWTLSAVFLDREDTRFPEGVDKPQDMVDGL